MLAFVNLGERGKLEFKSLEIGNILLVKLTDKNCRDGNLPRHCTLGKILQLWRKILFPVHKVTEDNEGNKDNWKSLVGH